MDPIPSTQTWPDCFELGSADKPFAERYAWIVKLSELLGGPKTSFNIEEDHDYTYGDEYYCDEYGEIMVSNTWKVWFDRRLQIQWDDSRDSSL